MLFNVILGISFAQTPPAEIDASPAPIPIAEEQNQIEVSIVLKNGVTLTGSIPFNEMLMWQP
jgi:hypothetical protein